MPDSEPPRASPRGPSVNQRAGASSRLPARQPSGAGSWRAMSRRWSSSIEPATPWLLGLTASMLSDQDEAEEVVHGGLHHRWDRVGALGDEHDALMPWLLRITRNRAIDRLRRRRRWRQKLARADA